MVEIAPFRGLLYNKEKVKDFSLVITPPYDVISEEQKEDYLKKSHYNFVNLILANDYDKAAEILNEWQNNGILKQDDKESVYLYEQNYVVNGKNYVRTGFISLLKIEELGEGVLPHEKTTNKPFEDRLKLLEATKANFGTLFLIYDDKEKIIDQKINEKLNEEPYIDFSENNVQHRLFKINDTEFINFLKNEMKNHQCFIADGHHRYKTSLHYSKKHGYNYVMVCLVNTFNEGMIILPTHRLLFGLDLDTNDFMRKIESYFEVEELADTTEMIKKLETQEIRNNVFGFYDNINKKSYFLKLKDKNKKLGVEIIHKLVIEDILGISQEEQEKGKNIEFVKGTKKTLEKLKNNKYQLAFFINPPSISDVLSKSRANETMPSKSTYFYPKLYSGLVINKF